MRNLYRIADRIDIRDINRDAMLNQGMAGWWMALPPLDGGAKLYDLCGINHGVLTGFGAGTGFRPTTRQGGYAHLVTGSTSNVTVTTPASTALDITGTGGISFGGWVYPTSPNLYQIVISKANGTNRQYSVYLNASGSGALFVAISGVMSGSSVSVSPGWTVNAWNHIFVTYNNVAVVTYQNGVQSSSTANTAAITTVASSGLYMGYDVGASNYIVSAFDDMRVYNRALSGADVYSLYLESIRSYPTTLRYRSRRRVFAAVAGSSAGTMAATLADDTFAGAGTFATAGTMAATLGSDAFAGSGTFATAGAMAATLGSDVFAGTGTFATSGTMAATLGSDVFAGVAGFSTSASIGITLGNDTFASTADFVGPAIATLAIAAGDDDFAALAGTTASGTVLVTAGDDDFAALAGTTASGTVLVTAGDDDFAGIGVLPITASMAITAGNDVFSGIQAGPDILSLIRPELMRLASYPISPQDMTLVL